MTEQQSIHFVDGAGYEKMMGAWSRLAGEVFLDWLRPAPGWRWVDIGCGNGAFTELIVERCAPAAIEGIDPSDAQLAFARQRHTANLARFQSGNATALPFEPASFDAAVMALVIFFVPQPAVGVAEMLRVVRPGGLVAAYAWDMLGGGYPHEPVNAALRELQLTPPLPPSADVARLDNLRRLWTDAGLRDVEGRDIVVERHFDDFDAFWDTALLSPAIGPRVNPLPAAERERLKARARELVPTDGAGRLLYTGRASAAKGTVPR